MTPSNGGVSFWCQCTRGTAHGPLTAVGCVSVCNRPEAAASVAVVCEKPRGVSHRSFLCDAGCLTLTCNHIDRHEMTSMAVTIASRALGALG